MEKSPEELVKQGKMEEAVQMVQDLLDNGADMDWIVTVLKKSHDEKQIQEILLKAMSEV